MGNNEETKYDLHWKDKGAYGLERIKRKNERKTKRKEKLSHNKRCSSCGRGGEYYNVSLVVDPFAYDMYGDVHYVRLCDGCYDSFCGDI